MKLKLSWGYKIAFVYLFFVAGIMVLVVKSMNHKMDIVSGNYYAEELKYQDRIDDVNRTATLKSGIDINVNSNDLAINFPADFAGKIVTGKVSVYCPADEKKDIEALINAPSNQMQIKLPANAGGYYYVKVNCSVEGKTYYFENKIFI